MDYDVTQGIKNQISFPSLYKHHKFINPIFVLNIRSPLIMK